MNSRKMEQANSFDKLYLVIYNDDCTLIRLGGLLKNDTLNETSFPDFESVIEYVQRLCL